MSLQDKKKAIESYDAWINELIETVNAAEQRGLPKEWSENYIIAMLPYVFRRTEDVRLP